MNRHVGIGACLWLAGLAATAARPFYEVEGSRLSLCILIWAVAPCAPARCQPRLIRKRPSRARHWSLELDPSGARASPGWVLLARRRARRDAPSARVHAATRGGAARAARRRPCPCHGERRGRYVRHSNAKTRAFASVTSYCPSCDSCACAYHNIPLEFFLGIIN